MFASSIRDFSRDYTSNLCLAFGSSFGIPLSSNTYVYGKVTYLFRSSNVTISLSAPYPSAPNFTYEYTESATLSFKQWTINAGMQRDILLFDDLTLLLNGGVTYSTVSEDLTWPDGVQDSPGANAFGLFAGIGLESYFSGTRLGPFAECQFDYCRADFHSGPVNLGGWNLTFGVRYYFDNR
jgi:opacity protein-like surface antigen